MEVTAESIVAELRFALGKDHPDIVAEACRVISVYRGWVEGRKVYDISTTGKRIRAARKLAGMDVNEFARRMNLTKFDILRIEGGKRPIEANKLDAACRICGVSRAWMLMESEEGGPPARRCIFRKTHASPEWYAYKKQQAEFKAAKKEAHRLSEVHRRAQAEARKRAAELKLSPGAIRTRRYRERKRLLDSSTVPRE